MNIDVLDTPSYTLYLNSNDKVSGNNNNAIFNVNWDSFLSREYDQYKVSYSFITAGGNYKDGTAYTGTTTCNFNNCRIICDFQGRSLSYNTATNASSNILGFAQRDMQSSTSTSNSFSCFFYQFPAKTIARPNQNQLNIQIYNAGLQLSQYNQLLIDSNVAGTALGTDMTSWAMVMEFIPVAQSKRYKGLLPNNMES
jgi:hypothetical protein